MTKHCLALLKELWTSKPLAYAMVVVLCATLLAHLIMLYLYGSIVIYEESKIVCALEIALVIGVLSWGLERLGILKRAKNLLKAKNVLTLFALLIVVALGVFPSPAYAIGWTSPTGHNDPSSDWTAEANAYDDDATPPATYATTYMASGTWSGFLELTHSAIASNSLRYYIDGEMTDSDVDLIDVDVERDGGWVDVYQGSFTEDEWIERVFTVGSVTKIRIRAHNDGGSGLYFALSEVDFYETPLIIIVTNAATNVEETTAALNGNITDTRGENADERGFDWGLTDSYGSSWTEVGSFGTGTFGHGIDSLSSGTIYHFRAKAHNSNGWGLGSDQTFTTKPNAPTGLTTSNPTGDSIDLDWAKGTGATHTMIRRKTTGYPTSPTDGTQAYYGTDSSTTDTGLPGNTTQYYGAWSYTDPNYSDGYSQATGTTGDTLAVLTLATTNMTTTTATFNGGIISVGNCSVIKYGFDWGHTQTATWSDEEVGTFYPGTFSMAITELEIDGLYYCRFWADDCEGRVYGNWTGFITAQPDYTMQEEVDNTMIPAAPDEPGGWIRPPKDWGEIGIGDATIPLTFFVFLCLVALIIPSGLLLTKYTKSLGVLFMVLGFILGFFSFWPMGGYLDWWVMFPYLLVGIALIMKEQQLSWS